MEKDAADFRIFSRPKTFASADKSPHLVEACCTVTGTVESPGRGERKQLPACQDATADDSAVWGVRLEEKEFTRTDHTETALVFWAPEVHFGNVFPRSQELVPVLVRHTDVALHSDIVHLWQGGAGDNHGESGGRGVPRDGSLVEVRGQRWVMSDSAPGGDGSTLLTLQSVEDGHYSGSLPVIWEVEPGQRVLPAGSLPEVTPTGFDPPERLGPSWMRSAGPQSRPRT